MEKITNIFYYHKRINIGAYLSIDFEFDILELKAGISFAGDDALFMFDVSIPTIKITVVKFHYGRLSI
jgi:hypothetical protein